MPGWEKRQERGGWNFVNHRLQALGHKGYRIHSQPHSEWNATFQFSKTPAIFQTAPAARPSCPAPQHRPAASSPTRLPRSIKRSVRSMPSGYSRYARTFPRSRKYSSWAGVSFRQICCPAQNRLLIKRTNFTHLIIHYIKSLLLCKVFYNLLNNSGRSSGDRTTLSGGICTWQSL